VQVQQRQHLGHPRVGGGWLQSRSVLGRGRPEVLTNRDGENITSSVVLFDGEQSTLLRRGGPYARTSTGPPAAELDQARGRRLAVARARRRPIGSRGRPRQGRDVRRRPKTSAGGRASAPRPAPASTASTSRRPRPAAGLDQLDRAAETDRARAGNRSGGAVCSGAVAGSFVVALQKRPSLETGP
jgi:hypothetical protein